MSFFRTCLSLSFCSVIISSYYYEFYCFRYEKHILAGDFVGGYEDYLFFLNERVLASLPNGENKAFRVPREAQGGMPPKFYEDKELSNVEKMQGQGFRLSSSSLNELGMEVQRHPCTKVSSRFSTPLLIIWFPEQEAALGQW